MMNKFASFSLAILGAGSALAYEPLDHEYAEVKTDYQRFIPIDRSNPNAELLSLSANYEHGYSDLSGAIYGIDAAMTLQNDQFNGLLGVHRAYGFEHGHIGGVGGLLIGNNAQIFYGLEGRFNYQNFALTARALDWNFENYADSYEIDLNASYNINENFSVFYDYSHFKLNDGDINFDDYFTGIEYRATDQLGIKLGIGEYHPIILSSNQSNVWRKFGFSLSYNFATAERRVFAPVKIPNFSLF